MSYLNRSGTTINAINYVDTLEDSNQILERTGTGRNNIAWNDPPSSIPSGLNTTPSQVLSGYKFVGSAGTLQSGTIPTQGGSTITPGTSNKTAVSAGRYVSGNVIIAGDSDLVASNIRNGKNIFGVTGNVKEYKVAIKDVSTSGSKSYYETNGGRNRTMYYVLVNNIGFTPQYAYASRSYDGARCTLTTTWSSYLVNTGSTQYQFNLSSVSFTSSSVEIIVPNSGTYNTYVVGYL